MTRITIVTAAGFALAVTLPAVSAQAQNGTLTRSFVSATGSDNNPCTITQPCQSFAKAYTSVESNGIVAALDPGKYGPLTISGPVTINGNGWGTITAQAQNNGITVNAGSGNVYLTGLEIDGAGAAYNGIVFNSGSSLIVIDCLIKDTTGVNGSGNGNGILIQPTAGSPAVMIKNTTVLNNSNAGIYFTPSESATVDGTLDQVTANLNTYGMYFDASPSNSFANAGVAGITVRIDDAHAVLNVKNGVVINPGSGGIVSIFKNTRIYQNNTGGSLNADLVANSSSQGAPQGVNLTDRNEIGLIGNNNAANSVVYTDGTNYITGTRLGQNVTLQTAPPQ